MNTSLELAGFFAAHAIWCVSSGETLIPLCGYTTAGARNMERLVADDLTIAVDQGKHKLQANEMNAINAALLYDGRISLEDRKCDAIIVEIRNYHWPDSRVAMAVPYTSKSFFRRFRVHRPKLFQWDNCDHFNMKNALEAFFAGVAQHEKGAEVWNKALDESK